MKTEEKTYDTISASLSGYGLEYLMNVLMETCYYYDLHVSAPKGTRNREVRIEFASDDYPYFKDRMDKAIFLSK